MINDILLALTLNEKVWKAIWSLFIIYYKIYFVTFVTSITSITISLHLFFWLHFPCCPTITLSTNKFNNLSFFSFTGQFTRDCATRGQRISVWGSEGTCCPYFRHQFDDITSPILSRHLHLHPLSYFFLLFFTFRFHFLSYINYPKPSLLSLTLLP